MVICSPELAMVDPRFRKLWKSKAFCQNIINVIVDEVHCVKDWRGFQDGYAKLGELRFTASITIPFHFATATLSPSRTSELFKFLSIPQDSVSVL